jgi:hypothetical protein
VRQQPGGASHLLMRPPETTGYMDAALHRPRAEGLEANPEEMARPSPLVLGSSAADNPVETFCLSGHRYWPPMNRDQRGFPFP